MRKYGFDNFEFTVLEDNITDQFFLDERERFWISKYEANNPEKGYNRDSGGISGGHKSKETKQLIGKTTKEKWKNEETASRMTEGLRKGTETIKLHAKDNFVIKKCLNCGKEMKLKPFEAKTKQFCSIQCVGKYNAKTGNASKASRKGIERKQKLAAEKKLLIKNYIIDWVKSNSNLVLNCPLNKISTVLASMLKTVEKDFGIKNFRSLFSCFEATGRKDFLLKLKEYC